MKKRIFLTGIVAALLATLFAVQVCFAWPSTYLQEKGGDIYDDWNICRTDACGDDGFLQIEETRTRASFSPVIALESLGEYADIAYKLGEQYAEEYPDRTQRAEKIFEYVRDRLRYVNDIDQFDMTEYAQNADEVAGILQEEGVALADCEEHALLLAVMCLGAGYRAGITLSPGHLAALLYMPGYEKANEVFTLGGESGWIWLEATGNNNPFGWFPKGQVEDPILACEIDPDEHLPIYQPQPPVLAHIGDREVDEGELLRFTVSATDADDDELAYSAVNIPARAEFNPYTGDFSWTPREAGIYPDIRFEASDGTLSDSEDITITVLKVNNPPILTHIGDREVNQDEILRFTLSATDENDDALTYSVTNLPTGAEFNPNAGTFSWTPHEAGIYAGVLFEVSDGAVTDSEVIAVIVRKKGSQAPVIAGIIAGVLVVAVAAVVILRRRARRAQANLQ